ncbi:hypothetical protein PENTCL1PPCAC_8602, partial [Pristionchus entomophagus]
ITMSLTLLVHRTIERWSLRTGFISSALYVGFMYTVLANLLLNSARIEDMLLSRKFDHQTQVSVETTPGHWKTFSETQIQEIIGFNKASNFPAAAILPSWPPEVDYQNRKWLNYTDEEH